MKCLFVDESRQERPSRAGIEGRPLLAVGGVIVDTAVVRALSDAIDQICNATGFPPRPLQDSEFKWSPGRKLWMWSHLTGPERSDFFRKVIDLLRTHNATAVVVAVDTRSLPAPGKSHTMSALLMLLERFHSDLRGDEKGIVVCDTPPGNRGDEHGLLSECVTELAAGTEYVTFDRLALPVLSAPSHLVRLLQAADLVTGCILAYIAGEQRFAPVIAREIRTILRHDRSRVGGYGIKLHPDFRYANLYHWLFEDSHFWKGNAGSPLPLPGRPYAAGPDKF